MGKNTIYAFSVRQSDERLRAAQDAVPKGEFSDVCRKALTLWFSADHSTMQDQLSGLRTQLSEIKRLLERGVSLPGASVSISADALDEVKRKLAEVGT